MLRSCSFVPLWIDDHKLLLTSLSQVHFSLGAQIGELSSALLPARTIHASALVTSAHIASCGSTSMNIDAQWFGT
jgi:hypothetical protein